MKLNGLISPRSIIQSEIVKAATGLEDSILKARFPVSDFVFNNSITFDPTDGMFNTNTQGGMPLVNAFVQVRQRFAFGLLFGLKDSHIIEREALKTGVLT